MKNLPLVLTFILIIQTSFAQNQKKTLYGSFVFEQQVFQYQYKRDGNIHSLKLSTLAQPDPTTNLDTAKFRKTEQFLRKFTTKESSLKVKDSSVFLKTASIGILDTIAQLPDYIKQLQNIKNSRILWKEHSKNIDKLIDIFDKYKIENIKFEDILVKDIYSVTELLTMYKGFIQNISEPQISQEIPFPELKQEEFVQIFTQELSQLFLKNNQSFEKLKPSANKIAMDIMYEIKARADFKDDEPITGYMNLKRKFLDIDFLVPGRLSKPGTEIKEHWFKKKETIERSYKDTSIVISVPFEVKNIIIEFEDGGIKNIFADLLPLVDEYKQVYGNNTIRFRNNKPISITGKFDPDVFRLQKIYSGNTLELMNNLYTVAKEKYTEFLFVKQDFVNSKSYNANFILSDVLDYKVVSETDNEDYSPTNSKIELSEPNSLVELKKEKRSKILSARVYTDFMGLSDIQPNGLVQTEISKRINIVPGRFQGLWIGARNQKGIYTGGLTYIEPRFTISKIEENNRYLNLNSSQLDKVKSIEDSSNHFLLNPLELLRYQQWSFGLDVNLFKINLHNRKSNFQINGNFTFGATSTADSIKITSNKITQIQSRNISCVSTTSSGFGIMYEVKPDSRYGLSFGYDFKWLDIFNNQFELNDMFDKLYHTAWFNGFFKVNDESKLFWRFRKNWLFDNNKYNFYQIQLGYELDIFKASK